MDTVREVVSGNRDSKTKPNQNPDCVVIGAGLAGLSAARHLAAAERSVLVVDKGKSVGGRLATRRMQCGSAEARLDHGAQFFTVRSESFQAEVETWQSAGVVDVWCHGFGAEDGYPRFRATMGMNSIAKHLADKLRAEFTQNVSIVTRAEANAVISGPDAWAVTYEAARREPDETAAIIAALPIPQTLALMRAGATTSPILNQLEEVDYHRVIAVLVVLDRSPGLPEPGALQQPDDPVFSFVADNQRKGISDQPAVTFHCNHGLSAELWDADDGAVLTRIHEDLRQYLGAAAVQEIQIKRWRYAGPKVPSTDLCAVASDSPGPLVLAGDAFANAKVEGAFLSGQAAADYVHAALGNLDQAAQG